MFGFRYHKRSIMYASMMRRFKLRRDESKETDARKHLKEDLYEYSKFCGLGFPYKPSAIAYDPNLDMLAIGTKSGSVRLYGQPGVCLQGQHKGDLSVTQMYFLPSQGKFITLCSDNSLHLWKMSMSESEVAVLEESNSFAMENVKMKTISSCCLLSNDNVLLVGTEEGNIYFLDILTFALSNKIIYQDCLTQNETDVNSDSDDVKKISKVIESIVQHPNEKNLILIGLNYGLIILWDLADNHLIRTFNSMQTLEYLMFVGSGDEFISSHADGSYIIWNTPDATAPKEPATAPYGPFPCKSITKILWETTSSEPYMIFVGGMPRASYGDRYTLTVMHGDAHVVLDFTSKVIDFVALRKMNVVGECEEGHEVLHTLIILAEEEIVAIDLISINWPSFRLPYLVSLHCSAITSMNHVSNVPECLWRKILNAGNSQFSHYSTRDWPINGGKPVLEKTNSRDLLLTGHEDGSVNFWDVTNGGIKLLHKLNTADLFGIDVLMHCDGSADAEVYDEWPPFRKVGVYDPFTDDPRLAIQKIVFCLLSETLMLAGTAGQVVMFQYEREEREQDIKLATINVASNLENFVWRGHNALEVKNSESKLAPGFHPTCIVQMLPPLPCTAVAFQPEWQLLSVGTAYGVGLFDYARRKTVYTKCTLRSSDGEGEGVTLSRRKSLQKMIRQSFRRLRSRTHHLRQTSSDGQQQQQQQNKGSAETKNSVRDSMTENQGEVKKSTLRSSQRKDIPSSSSSAVLNASSSNDVRSSSQETTFTSVIRCLHFAEVFLFNTQTCSSTLWMGTNQGNVYIYQLNVPTSERRLQESVQCNLAKEIRLRHGAPVVNIQVLDHSGRPLPGPLEVQHERAKAPDMTGSQYVVVSSQQQLKVFSLPTLKAYRKYKLTHVQLVSVAYSNFRSNKDETYVEADSVCLTTDGDISLFTIPQLKHQLSYSVIPKENMSAVNGCVFTPNGMGFCLCSPSELEQFSLSTRFPSVHPCTVELKRRASQMASIDVADDSTTQNTDDRDVADSRQHSHEQRHDHFQTEESLQNEGNDAINSSNQVNDSQSQTTTQENNVAAATSGPVDGDEDTSTAAAQDAPSLLVLPSVTCAPVLHFPLSTRIIKADVHVDSFESHLKPNIEEKETVFMSKTDLQSISFLSSNIEGN